MKVETDVGMSSAIRMLRLTGIASLLLVVAQPGVAQRKQPVDPEATEALACRQAVKEKVAQEHGNAQKVHVNLETAVEWQENDAEKILSGQGRFQGRSENWREFRYQCIYYLRTGQLTDAEIQLGSVDDEPEDIGVTLYRDPGFRGMYETFSEDRSDLRGTRIGDDQATSVRVSHGCIARLYRDLDFRGAYTEVTAEIGDLRGSRVGDDSVTSVRVRCDGQGFEEEFGDEPRDDWQDDPFSYGVTLYRDLNYRGTSQTFSGDAPDLRDSRIGDDQATSVKLSRGCRARLYQDLNYRGQYTEVSADIPDLRGSRVGDDSITSLQVRCDR